MASKDAVITVKDKWLDLKKIKLPSGLSRDAVESVVSGRSVRIEFDVVIPGKLLGDGEQPPEFDLGNSPEVQRLRKAMEERTVETLQAIVMAQQEDQDGDEEAHAKADKALKALNDYLKGAFDGLRPLVRSAIAKTLGGKAKPDQLQTMGSIDFKELTIVAGSFENELSVDTGMLDLTKALKRKKWQQCGLAWKSKKCVISVRPKKSYKPADLKELKKLLPDGMDRGASMLSGRFQAEAGTKVNLELPIGKARPNDVSLRVAFREQTGHFVHVTILEAEFEEEDDDEETESESAGKLKVAKGKGGAKGKTAKGKTAKGKTAKSNKKKKKKGKESDEDESEDED